MAQSDTGCAVVLDRDLGHGGAATVLGRRHDPIVVVLALPRCRRPGVARPGAGMDAEFRDVLLPAVRGDTDNPAALSIAIAHRRTVQP